MKRNFTLIVGNGNKIPKYDKFIYAEVTNTRLMGVLALHMQWTCNGDMLHQLFYFDAEEYGLESYQSLWSEDPSEVNTLKDAMAGGLGGDLISLSEQEALHLLDSFCAYNRRWAIPLPPPKSEYAPLLSKKSLISELKEHSLMQKICIRPSSDYELINYYLMRLFGRDYQATTYLSGGKFLHTNFFFERAAFLTNTIKDNQEESLECDAAKYTCESLIDIGGDYKIVLSEMIISQKSHIVMGAECISSLNISPIEASLLLNKREYITVYTIWDSDIFQMEFEKNKPAAMKNVHACGILYIEFHPTNAHVNRSHFTMNEDVKAMYYITDSQVIAAAYHETAMDEAENFIETSSLASSIVDMERFNFKDSVIYEFIQGDWNDFYEFLSDIGGSL